MKVNRTIKRKMKKPVDKSTDMVTVAAYPALVHKLREMSFGIRGGDNWIRSISDSHLLSLYDLITTGKPEEVILEHARSSWKYAVMVNCNADIAALKLFSRQVLNTSIHGLVPTTKAEKEIRQKFMQRARFLLNQFDPIAELIALSQEQRRRVQMGLDGEIVTGKLSPSVSSEITTFNRMLHELVEKLQRLGMIEEKPLEHVLQISGTFTNVVDLISKAGSQDKMLNIANDFLTQIEDSVVHMKQTEDGTFVEVK